MFNNKEHNNFKLNLHFKFKHIFYEEEKEKKIKEIKIITNNTSQNYLTS